MTNANGLSLACVGFGVEYWFVFYCNRFITAASDGDVDAVKAYLKEGLDVNSQDWDKLTALIAAASQGHITVVKLLLEKVRPCRHENDRRMKQLSVG